MEKDGTYSDSSKPNFAIEAAIVVAELASLGRAVLENLGILKLQPLGKKKPEGGKFWEKIDRLAGIKPEETGKWKVRAAIIALIAIPMAIIAFNIWSLASNAKPAQENKKQEKETPAPRKATGMKLHESDVFYKMAFARQLPKNTFAVAQKQPISQKRQPAANRIS